MKNKQKDELKEALQSEASNQKGPQKPCTTCDGRGIRPEISVHEVCPDCKGSGTIEA